MSLFTKRSKHSLRQYFIALDLKLFPYCVEIVKTLIEEALQTTYFFQLRRNDLFSNRQVGAS